MLIEQACHLQWKGFDFLLGAEGYKTLWCNDEAEVVNIPGFHRWAPAYFWFSRGKPFVRQRLQVGYLKAIAWFQKRRKRAVRNDREYLRRSYRSLLPLMYAHQFQAFLKMSLADVDFRVQQLAAAGLLASSSRPIPILSPLAVPCWLSPRTRMTGHRSG